MERLIELLESPAYRHVLLNHLPLTGLGLAWIVLAWATFENRWRSMAFGLVLVMLASASAFAVMESGEEAYPFVFDAIDGVSRAWLDHHTHLADRWGWVVVSNAAVAAVAIGLGRRRADWRRPVAILLLGTTLACLTAAAVIAEAGGQVRHPEFRLSDPPRHDEPGRLR